jgi:threonine/homoserine/homoserine lactone efflux protein
MVTSSGALSPGPLFFATMNHGSKSGARGGFLFSVGHTIFEFPFVLVIAFGLLATNIHPVIERIVGILGGIFLIYFGISQIRIDQSVVASKPNYVRGIPNNPLIQGLVFTALNPFFIMWWLTVGSKMVLNSLGIASSLGILIMYFSHVWIDFAWLMVIGHLAHKGTNLLGRKSYLLITRLCGVILILFGISFLYSSF